MRRLAPLALLLTSFMTLALGAASGCATAQDDAPFPHRLEAGAAGAMASAGAVGMALGGAGASSLTAGGAGAPSAEQGGGGAGAAQAGAPPAGAGSAGSSTAGAGGAADACPNNPLKTAPGACGCDTTADQEAACQGLIRGLVHRYSFSGSGTSIKDTQGTANADAINMSLSNTGNLDFTTGDQYADLPNAILSTLTNVTLEAFVTWQGGGSWQRICDFGEDTTGAENNRSSGRSYVFLSPHGSGNFVRAVYRKPDTPEVIIDSIPSLTIGDPAQVALVIDDDHDLMTLYVNGAEAGSAPFPDHLSNVHDINNWLGRSQFATDPPYVGNMHEFRIYSSALSGAELAYSYEKGPDAAYFTP